MICWWPFKVLIRYYTIGVNDDVHLTHLSLVSHICVNGMVEHWFRWWFVACSAPSHYLNQCWFTIDWTIRNKIRCNSNQNTTIFIHKNASENIIYDTTAILSWGRWVNICVSSVCVLLVITVDDKTYRQIKGHFDIADITFLSQQLFKANNFQHLSQALTHWGRVTHICVGKLTIIGSYNGLSPGRRQAIIRTNAGILLIRTLRTNFSEFLVEILIFSFKKIRLKVSSAKCCSFRLGLNVLRLISCRNNDHHLIFVLNRKDILL